jgi:hypothetical protein
MVEFSQLSPNQEFAVDDVPRQPPPRLASSDRNSRNRYACGIIVTVLIVLGVLIATNTLCLGFLGMSCAKSAGDGGGGGGGGSSGAQPRYALLVPSSICFYLLQTMAVYVKQ